MGKAKIFVLTILLLSCLPGLCQLVTYRKETIFTGNKPYAYLEKSGSAWAHEFILRNIAKEELVSIKPVSKQLGDEYDFIFYEVAFKGFEKIGEMQDDDDFARILAYEFGRFRILKNDSLDRNAVALFLEKHPAGKFSERFDKKNEALVKPNSKNRQKGGPVFKNSTNHNKLQNDSISQNPIQSEQSGVSIPTIESNQNAAVPPLISSKSETTSIKFPIAKKTITIAGNEIRKGKKTIGYFSTFEKQTGGLAKNTINFQDSKKRKIATAVYTGKQSNNCQLYTFKDRKNRVTAIPNSSETVQAIAAFLVQEGYL